MQECSNDNVGLGWTFFMARSKFAFWVLIWEEFMEQVEDFDAKEKVR